MVYFIAQIKINDKIEYQEYVKRVDEVFAKYNGKYLSFDENPDILEGEWNYGRAVLIQFPTKIDFEAWYYSDEYQEILKHRLTAADCDTILIQGSEY